MNEIPSFPESISHKKLNKLFSNAQKELKDESNINTEFLEGKEDFEELWEKDIKAGPILDVTREFNEYIQEIGKADDAKKRLFAHCYTRHMGDMMGGQILAKMVPGSGKLYQFPDKLELQGKIRARLTDDLVSEVKVAYKFAQKTFEQMMPYVKHE